MIPEQPESKITEVMEEKLPEGKVRIPSGKIVDRAAVGFYLGKTDQKNILIAMDGTIYRRERNGSLKRLTPKKKGRDERRNNST